MTLRAPAPAPGPLFTDLPVGIFAGTVSLPSLAAADTAVTVNPCLRDLFGFDASLGVADVRPLDPERFADPGARARLLNRFAGQGHVTDHLVRMLRLDGSSLWVEISASARPTGEAGRWMVEAVLRDVTERQRLDEQSRNVQHQLLHADKMAALGQTVSGVAHELNNPLATILSWAERLGERHLDDTSRRGAGIIAAEAERAARIVRNLLTFARKRQSTRAVVDVNLVVRDTLALRAHDRRGTRLRLREELTPDLPGVFADAHQIQQILLNLVINAEQALRANSDGGAITIRTGAASDRTLVFLEVEDNGPGVPPELRERIFDPFFTTKDVGQGTGLGLSVVYALVKEHAGRIALEEPIGGGARFRIELPAGGIPEQPVMPAMSGSARSAAASVLVVEDEQALAAAVVETLADAGFTVTYAPDGERALTRLQERRFDVMVCDITMPRMDGITLFRTMGTVPGIEAPPVIFVTGEVDGVEVARFLAESGSPWLAKPFRLADLLDAVRRVLREA